MALAAGCGSGAATRVVVSTAGGPPGVVRVGLSAFRWPLDPALATGRDETTLARTLYATPLRTDPATGTVVPGLCRAWSASADFRQWRFTCRAATSIAAALRRVARLRNAPAHWLFADAVRISATGSKLVVRLSFPWRRFPYALTVVGASPRFVRGPFRLVTGSPRRVVVRTEGLTVVFRKLSARAAARSFEHGELDEAPVAPGDVRGTEARLGSVVRTRTLLGLDLVVFHRLAAGLRHAYWQTANRTDYAELVGEAQGSAAYSVAGSGRKANPRAFRDAVKSIPSLPRVRVRIGVPADPLIRSGARLLYAQWREAGLGPQLVTEPARALNGSFGRWIAAYPQEEAIPAELALRASTAPRTPLLRALGKADQRGALERLDEELHRSATVVPVAWVVDARLVSPRLEGWREDALGDVDYAGVRSRASSRRP